MTRSTAMLGICCLTLATGCFYDHLIERVQIGPDKWPAWVEKTQPASQPAGTAEDRLEKMMEIYK